jgi:uncharacterized protein YbaR (Trm112 family)/SAM-dependent methyltransferase
MRRRLLKWLACPLCQRDLSLLVAREERAPISESDRTLVNAALSVEDRGDIEHDIVTGALTCDPCRVYYPIYNGVPRLLTYPTRVAEMHAQEHRAWVDQHLARFRLPSATPSPGEENVLRTFSAEWTGYEWTGKSYWSVTPDAMLTCKRYELGLSRRSLARQVVLEVGIGIGGTADALTRTEGCELIGMDLGYAVDQARRYFGGNPLLHIVQASVFAPPFRSGTFDVVYSHGVLHHTYSTRDAFRHVARLPKPNGGMLYVWLYSHARERATPLRRILMGVEHVVRPVLSHLPNRLQTASLLPTVPAYLLYQNLYRRSHMGGGVAARYGWNEALHAARDRLTPPFAHRHSYEEVAGWFRDEKYSELECLRDEPLPDGVPDSIPLDVGIRGFRRAQ